MPKKQERQCTDPRIASTRNSGDRVQNRNKPQKQKTRWTPKKTAQTGQTSCLRDTNGVPITTEGQSEDSPVILTDNQEKLQEGTDKEITTNLEPTVRGSQVVVHVEVQATNCFKVLMPAEENIIQKSDPEKQSNMELVPYVAATNRGDKEILLEENYEKVITEFDPSEVGFLSTEGEEGLSEDIEEQRAYSIQKG
ncbi:hypothetical protein IFM89_006485 [Coptis chinensis]|uniref:Uncharacterized protein n=1 Tax=Coptis chinensis TaxID=261450 RepID=A0A835M4G8_9MAGN|nr:hypothetical protein IFM89_006485 [Coptis chinensis]